MKNLKKIICLLLVFIMMLGAVSCTKEGNTDDSSDSTPSSDVESVEQTEPAENFILDIVKAGKSDFKIVYPVLSDSTIVDLAKKIQKTIKDYTGATLEITDDKSKSEYEILIGDTGRRESRDMMGELRIREGVVYIGEKKLVIAGGNEDYLKKAAAKLINLIYQSGKKGTVDGDLQLKSADNSYVSYKYPTSADYAINGNAIKDYIIVYKTNSIIAKYCAYDFQRTVMDRVGYKLSVFPETENRADREILVGLTSRTSGSVAKESFAIELQGDKLCLMFDDLVSQEQVIDHFNNKLFIGDAEKFTADNNYRASLSDVLEGSERTALGNTGDIRIITNNIYQALSDYEERMTYLTMVYEVYAPDVICLQEAGERSWNRSKDKSVHALMQKQGYTTELAGGTQSNATPIIYNTKTLDLIESGYFQFTGANNSASKSFTWCYFNVKATGKKFICFSTHFMYNSGPVQDADITPSLWKDDSPTTYEATRVNNAKELEAKMKELKDLYNCPIFGGGDTNSTWDSEAYKYLTETAGFKNVRDIADVQDDHIGTCRATCAIDSETGFFFDYLDEKDMKQGKVKGEIDSMFAFGDAGKYHVLTHDVIIHDFSAGASDHMPVLADIKLK